ncbi:MAG: NUDIX domain-containing protein [Thermoanaerobaculia bacterium]|nr:NUDIX domain-containing protein [Thermoanaerobaculia bacterium]
MSPSLTLLETLAAFEPVDAVERGHHTSITRLVETSPAPFSRHSFDPGHVTASAFIIDTTGARLLLHHHRRLDRWLQMGGHVDEGELVVDAALREAREESGLDELALAGSGPFDLDVHAIPAGKGEPAHLHFDVRFVVHAASPEAIRVAANESLELRWFTFEEALEAMASPESARAIGKIMRTAARMT